MDETPMLSDGQCSEIVRALLDPDHHCAHNMTPVFDLVARMIAEAEAEALRDAAAMFDDDSLPYSATDVRLLLLTRADELAP